LHTGRIDGDITMVNNPIVEEVHKHRREIEKECGNDMKKIYTKAKEEEQKIKEHLVTTPLRKTGSQTYAT